MIYFHAEDKDDCVLKNIFHLNLFIGKYAIFFYIYSLAPKGLKYELEPKDFINLDK